MSEAAPYTSKTGLGGPPAPFSLQNLIAGSVLLPTPTLLAEHRDTSFLGVRCCSSCGGGPGVVSTCDISQLPEARAASAGAGEQTQGSPRGRWPATILVPKSPQAAHTHVPHANISRSTLKGILPEQKRVLTKMSAGDFQFYMG